MGINLNDVQHFSAYHFILFAWNSTSVSTDVPFWKIDVWAAPQSLTNERYISQTPKKLEASNLHKKRRRMCEKQRGHLSGEKYSVTYRTSTMLWMWTRFIPLLCASVLIGVIFGLVAMCFHVLFDHCKRTVNVSEGLELGEVENPVSVANPHSSSDPVPDRRRPRFNSW